MKLQKRVPALLLAVLLLCTACVGAFAHDVPDESKKGTITVTMTYDGRPVPGGALTLYRVGDIAQDDGNYSFVLNDAFKESGADLTDITSDTLAQELARYAANERIEAVGTQRIGNDGTAVFEELELGLYLVVQSQAAAGYYRAAPFLVSVPMMENGKYVYEIDASPKVELEKAPVTPPGEPDKPTPEEPDHPTPDEPGTPVTPGTPGTPTEPTLPQTGQLNWPVPVLVVLGLALVAVGWALRFGRKQSEHEK